MNLHLRPEGARRRDSRNLGTTLYIISVQFILNSGKEDGRAADHDDDGDGDNDDAGDLNGIDSGLGAAGGRGKLPPSLNLSRPLFLLSLRSAMKPIQINRAARTAVRTNLVGTV